VNVQDHGFWVTAGTFVLMVALKFMLPERFWESEPGKKLVRGLPAIIGGLVGGAGFSQGDLLTDVASGSGLAVWAQVAYDAIKGGGAVVKKGKAKQ
jgi:hypothetical protein